MPSHPRAREDGVASATTPIATGNPAQTAALHAALTALSRGDTLPAGDRHLAHHLALRPATSWGPAEETAAADIAARHRHALATARIDYRRLPPAPLPEAATTARDALADGARRAALSHLTIRRDGRIALTFPYHPDLAAQAQDIAGHERDPDGPAHLYPVTALPALLDFAHRHAIPVPEHLRAALSTDLAPTATRDPDPVVRVRPDGDVEVVFPARTTLVYLVRALPGRRWDPAARANVFPPRAAAMLVAFADAHGITVDDAVWALGAASSNDRPQVTLDDATGALVVGCDYRPDLHAALRTANDDRTAWHRDRSAYVLTARADAGQLLATVDRFGLRIDDGAATQLRRWRGVQQRNLAESLAAAGPPVTVAGLAVPLHPHQQLAVRFLTRNRRVAFADPPGSGQHDAVLAALEATRAPRPARPGPPSGPATPV
ncbi:hypothetical protein [Krasilnikovia sp. MM14-A1259]|uniref:hypothetical protein n=1 Tax=Krasilnikovia sp. MM14-A1259 TaxID=3373539 RepID=UPI003820E890